MHVFVKAFDLAVVDEQVGAFKHHEGPGPKKAGC
jgi:hypothetical protein